MLMCLPYFSKELNAGEVRRDLASYETCTGQQSGQPPAKIRNRWKERRRLAAECMTYASAPGQEAFWCGHLQGGRGQPPSMF